MPVSLISSSIEPRHLANRKIGCQTSITGFSNVPMPAYANGVAYVCTGFMTPQLWAIRTGGSGDVTDTHVLWKLKQGIPQEPSILLVGEELYFVADTGVARCVDAKTGDSLWQHRLEGKYTASPVYAFVSISVVCVLGAIFGFAPKGVVAKPARETL